MSQIINVSSKSELLDALANAKGGDTILLAEGHYGDLALTGKSGFDSAFSSEVVIASADPEHPAVFSGLDMRDSSNLTFDGIMFDYTFKAGDNIWDRPFNVMDSSNITIRNSTFDGDLANGVSESADGYGYAIGLSFRNSTGVNLEQNEFFEFYRGMTISTSSDIQVVGNDLHSLRMDGMNFSEVTKVLIENNHIHDFNASLNSLDHSDMIQFWTNGTNSPSTDITIRGNHLDIGAGDATQSIFMRNDLVDRGIKGEEMFYQNILIEENVIINGHSHGITVGETNGLTIRQNSVLHADGRVPDGRDPLVEIPRINVAEDSQNVTITNNATANITGVQNAPGWTVRDNAFVQDQSAQEEGYYGDVFITSSLTMTGGTHGFLAVPGGILDRLSAGSSATHDLTNTSELTARFHITESQNSAAIYHFDASNSTIGGSDLPAGTVFTWSFADGTVLTGEKVTYGFESGGDHEAILTVTLPTGQADKAPISVAIPSSNLVSYDISSGFTYDDTPDASSEIFARSASPGIVTTSQGIALQIDREHVVDIIGQDEFTISMTLQGKTPGDSGEIMRLNGSFIISLNADGNLYLRMLTADGGQIKLTTENANINDGAIHNIEINFIDNSLSIEVDGRTLASTSMEAPLRGADGHDLVFGNPWDADNFESTMTAFEITVNASDFSEAANLEQGGGETPEPEMPSISTPILETEGEPTPNPETPEQEVAVSETPQVLTTTGTNASENLAPGHTTEFIPETHTNNNENLRECGTAPEQSSTKSNVNIRTSHDTQDAFEAMLLLSAPENFFG